jgi:hypothetical protein
MCNLASFSSFSCSYYLIDRTPKGDYLKHCPDDCKAFFEGSYPLSSGEVEAVQLIDERTLLVVFNRDCDQLQLKLQTRQSDGPVGDWFVALQSYAIG